MMQIFKTQVDQGNELKNQRGSRDGAEQIVFESQMSKMLNKQGTEQPNVPKTQSPEVQFDIKQVRIFDDNVLLINPMIDASNKQIYALNGYKTAHKNVVCFITNGDKA